MTRHLVTGGAGFIGSALVKRLLAEGHEVNVFDRMSRGKESRVPLGATVYRGDIRDALDVKVAAAGCDVIWHLAYIQGTQNFYADPRLVIDVALRGIVNVLEARDVNNAELIVISSSEVYQEPPPDMFPTNETVPLSVPDVTNPRYSYGGGKIASEIATLAAAASGKRALVIRPHNIVGPDMGEEHVIPQIARRVQELKGRELTIQGDGTATRCFCYIDDAVDGLMVAYEHGENGNVYHLGDDHHEVEIRALARDIADYYGRAVVVKPAELPKGSPMRRLPDIAKLRELGYDPAFSYGAMLEHTLEWYR